jgi:DNA ligase-1
VLAGNRRGSNLSLRGIVEGLKTIADTTGAGAQENKIGLLEDLLKHCAGVETKYVVRIVLGKLRLGIGEMIFLAGLSRAISAPAVCSGLNELKTAQPLIGKPIRMMLVQRIRDLAEASAHIRGALFVEYKYDGERAQAHVSKGRVVLYSRRLEDITEQFPDVVKAVGAALGGTEAIVEGEMVAINARSGKLGDFQTLMRRRRKYQVEASRCSATIRTPITAPFCATSSAGASCPSVQV